MRRPERDAEVQLNREAALVVGHNYEVDNLNPLSPSNNGEILVQAEIYAGLTRPAPSGAAKIAPGLVDRWKESKNRKSWTLHIRPTAKFSNGQPVSATDVKFSLDRFIDPKKNVIFPSLVTDFKSVDVVNPSTVRVNLKKPVSPFLHYISMFPAFIVPKALVEKDEKAFYKAPVSAGPYRIKEFVRGSHITLERNPYYWEKGLPHYMKCGSISSSRTTQAAQAPCRRNRSGRGSSLQPDQCSPEGVRGSGAAEREHPPGRRSG